MRHVLAVQTNKVSEMADIASIASLYLIAPSTIPKRNVSLDWAYGDRAEVYAVSYTLLQSLRSYCLNRIGGVYSALLKDEACMDSIYPYPQGFPNYYSRLETALQLLTSYGIEGNIERDFSNHSGGCFLTFISDVGDLTVPTINVVTGVEGQQSVISGQLATSGGGVNYCSPYPWNPSGGFTPSGRDVTLFIRDHAAIPQSACTGDGRRSLSEEDLDINVGSESRESDLRGTKLKGVQDTISQVTQLAGSIFVCIPFF